MGDMRNKKKQELYDMVSNLTREHAINKCRLTTEGSVGGARALTSHDKFILNAYKNFKNLHKNETAILFGSGPTFLEYKEFSDSLEWLRVGVNGHHFIFPDNSEKNTFDIIFMVDMFPDYYKENKDLFFNSSPYYTKFVNVNNSKFLDYFEGGQKITPMVWHTVDGREEIQLYDYSRGIYHNKVLPTWSIDEEVNVWKKDLSAHPFGNGGMSTWNALQFILCIN